LEKAANRSYLPRCIKTVHAWKEGHLDRHVEIMKEVKEKLVTFRPIPPEAVHHFIPLRRAGMSIKVQGDTVYLRDKAEISLVEKQLRRALACIGCGKCINACPNGAIVFQDGHYKVIAEICSGCLACVRMECSALKFPVIYTHCIA
jgi:ferredoxin